MDTPSSIMVKPTRPAASTQAGMPFIVSSNLDGVDQATRKLIRSHVMRGKKQKKYRVRAQSTNTTQKARLKLQDVIDMHTVLQPGRVGTHMYFVDYPKEMEPSMLMKMAHVSTAAMRIMFPLLMEIGFHPESKPWTYPAGRDVVTFHINAFAIQSFIDRVLNRQPADKVNPVATLHHQKGLLLLRRRLDADDDKDNKISDETLSVVVKLTTAAQFDGDAETAKQHMQGIRTMLELRGGLSAFVANTKLLVEIWRCDLGTALLANSATAFYRTISESVPDYPEQINTLSFGPQSPCSEEIPHFSNTLARELGEVWRFTKKFCLLANLATQTQTLIQPAVIYGTMTAVMYRLLRMEYAAGSLDETTRLGLLAFTHHTFLQWKDIHLPCHGFSIRYRSYLLDHQLEDVVPSHVMLWLLMTGAVSTLKISAEPWLTACLRTQMKRCGVKSWKDMQDALKVCMWIPLLSQEKVKQIYEWLSASSII